MTRFAHASPSAPLTPSASRVSSVGLVARDLPPGWREGVRFELGRRTFEVLSGGVQFARRENLIYVVFDAYPDDGPQLPDLGKNIGYIAAETCGWFSIERV